MPKVNLKAHLSMLAGAALALLAVFFISPSVQAGEAYSSASTSRSNINCIDNGVRPSPYSGGAGVSRVFYPADGSTVTVTNTGAVIKQSPCQTPYREGWVNPSDTCNMNSYSDLSGGIRPGDTNPYTNNSGTCAVNTSPNTSTSSAATCCNSTYTSNCCNNTASCCNNNGACCSNTSSCCNTSSTATTTTTQPVTYTTAANTSKGATLPNTGPGDVLALGGISTFVGTIGHFLYRVRQTRVGL